MDSTIINQGLNFILSFDDFFHVSTVVDMLIYFQAIHCTAEFFSNTGRKSMTQASSRSSTKETLGSNPDRPMEPVNK